MWSSGLEWRTEIWHAVIVHFPVATMTLAVLTGICSFFVRKPEIRKYFSVFFTALLILAVASGWLAIYTGQLSYNVVVRQICDPPALQEHQRWSFAAAYIFSAVLLFRIALYRVKTGPGRIVLQCLLAAGLLSGAVTLFRAGHLGAAAVYQQGAAVNAPGENCK